MDRTSGDGADSAEDSGSSQPYPSTLPGIPKVQCLLSRCLVFSCYMMAITINVPSVIQGSARQLFQRLQGPMEEETLKSHFEKIITIGQKQQYRRNQVL